MKSFLFTLVALLGVSFSLSAKPLKVYLLVGQSNMQGHAAERTLAHLGMDPKTKPLLEAIQNADGTAKVHDRIWISSIDTSQESGVKEGKRRCAGVLGLFVLRPLGEQRTALRARDCSV